MSEPLVEMRDVHTDDASLIELREIEKHFGAVIALAGVSVAVYAGECHCLLGDNGAGKSTFIKTMAGVHKPTTGQIFMGGQPVTFESPRDAMLAGIATVYQDLAMIPLMSVTRNFWMGREPTKGWGPFKYIDFKHANEVTMTRMADMGIRLREPNQAVGTLSGGERQTVAIARAVYFGAKILILDEPTSALGVRQTSNVLATIDRVRKSGIGVVFITHNVPSRHGGGRPLHGAEPGDHPGHGHARGDQGRRASGHDGRRPGTGAARRLPGRHRVKRTTV